VSRRAANQPAAFSVIADETPIVIEMETNVQPAIEAIWSGMSGDLRQYIRRRVADEHLAEDLLQEVFLRIHRHLPELRAPERLAAWVYRIARNVVRDHYRKFGARPVSLDEMEVEERRDAHSTLGSQAAVWLRELIEEIPDPYRQAVTLSEIEGLPQREIAGRLGLSISGAKSRVQRGRAMLKEVLHQCCTFEFDRRGNVTDCDPKSDRSVCRNCE
jgi:RNA polymerase sigma-70 factor (ECF subfamily)